MNRTPEILAELRAAILEIPPAELPSIIGQVEAVKAEAFARLCAPPPAEAADAPQPEVLLTPEQVAERLGGDYTARWVREHQDKFPRVRLPGRKLRFSAKRLDEMIRRRGYDS
jgi:hypothetical protein